jgi:hypothetical protein
VRVCKRAHGSSRPLRRAGRNSRQRMIKPYVEQAGWSIYGVSKGCHYSVLNWGDASFVPRRISPATLFVIAKLRPFGDPHPSPGSGQAGSPQDDNGLLDLSDGRTVPREKARLVAGELSHWGGCSARLKDGRFCAVSNNLPDRRETHENGRP